MLRKLLLWIQLPSIFAHCWIKYQPFGKTPENIHCQNEMPLDGYQSSNHCMKDRNGHESWTLIMYTKQKVSDPCKSIYFREIKSKSGETGGCLLNFDTKLLEIS